MHFERSSEGRESLMKLAENITIAALATVGLAESAPATYVERVIIEPQPAVASLDGPPAQAQAQAQWWHYCQDSQSFYPYVQQCASP
jgi:hypothetical protein